MEKTPFNFLKLPTWRRQRLLTLFFALLFNLSACEKQTSRPMGQFALRFADNEDASFAKTDQFELMSVPSGATTNLLWVERKVQLGGESIREVHLHAVPSTTLKGEDVVRLHPENATSINTAPDSVVYEVIVGLSVRGQEVLRRITKENIGRRLVIVIDGKAITAPIIYEPIDADSLAIAGQQYTKEYASKLADTIRSCMKTP